MSTVDELLPAGLRELLEERYWRPIEQGARLEALADDASFLADPVNHPGLFPDHSVIHAYAVYEAVNAGIRPRTVAAGGDPVLGETLAWAVG